MVHVVAGTDTYGRVQCVLGTPIVTKFAMFQLLPLYPLQSFYFIGSGRPESNGIPLIANYYSTTVHGIALARVDVLSVCMAYVRSVFAAMVLIGVMGNLVVGISYISGERLDDFALNAWRWLFGVLVLGVVGGSLSLWFPITPRREHEIRAYCHELLGIAIDPARLPPDVAFNVRQFVERVQGDAIGDRKQWVRSLVAARASLAESHTSRPKLESITDAALSQLRRGVAVNSRTF